MRDKEKIVPLRSGDITADERRRAQEDGLQQILRRAIQKRESAAAEKSAAPEKSATPAPTAPAFSAGRPAFALIHTPGATVNIIYQAVSFRHRE